MSAKHGSLLKRAMIAAETTTLEDVEAGLRAEVEISADALSRAIRIFDGDIEVSLTVVHQAGATKPRHYPSNVPFISVANGTISGDIATWVVGSGSDLAGIQRLRRGAEELLESRPDLAGNSGQLAAAVRQARGADAVQELLKSFMDNLDDEASAMIRGLGGQLAVAGEGARPTVDAAVAEILAFFADRGWSVSESDPGGTARRHVIERGGRSLTLTATSGFGVPTITLMGSRS
jgi:hypothetical protein